MDGLNADSLRLVSEWLTTWSVIWEENTSLYGRLASQPAQTGSRISWLERGEQKGPLFSCSGCVRPSNKNPAALIHLHREMSAGLADESRRSIYQLERQIKLLSRAISSAQRSLYCWLFHAPLNWKIVELTKFSLLPYFFIKRSICHMELPLKIQGKQVQYQNCEICKYSPYNSI